MTQSAETRRPLATVLADLVVSEPGLVLMRGQDYGRVELLLSRARREAVSGPPETRDFLSVFDFWWQHGPDGRVVVMKATALGDLPYLVEPGSTVMPAEWSEAGLHGVIKRKPGMPDDPMSRDMREGFWRMMQRIHHGIPGFKGTGFVHPDGHQFTGGLAGVNTAWTLEASGMTSAMIETIPVAGFYLFGALWPQVLHVMGFKGWNVDVIIRKLDEEFGPTEKWDLQKGTVPIPKKEEEGPSMGAANPAAEGSMLPGIQFGAWVGDVRFKVVYTKHFVERFLEDEEDRPAVSRYLSADDVRDAIMGSLSAVLEVVLDDPRVEGIIVSTPQNLSLKFFAIPIPGGWQLNMVTMIFGMPLRRTSPREVVLMVS